MRRLFRSFERSGLRYLLISGQASVLYGAAPFSEDVDIWIEPTPRNVRRLLRALGACKGRVYKLTPPLTRRNLLLGHGFHFVVPAPPVPIYLDVLGRPPRVGSFAASRRNARILATDWGALPVVDHADLVELKKTRRLSDYEVISNLVRARLAQAPAPGRALLRWAARNSFRAEDRVAYLLALGMRASVEKCRRRIATEVARLQTRDARYWRRIIDELRRLYRSGGLIAVGTPVAKLLRRPERAARRLRRGAAAARS